MVLEEVTWTYSEVYPWDEQRFTSARGAVALYYYSNHLRLVRHRTHGWERPGTVHAWMSGRFVMIPNLKELENDMELYLRIAMCWLWPQP